MNMMKMMKQAGQMKSKIKDLQDKIKDMERQGEAAGGAVTCTVNGEFKVTEIKIQPAIVNAGDVEILEDAVLASLNDAHGQMKGAIAEETKQVMESLGLPPGMDLPF